MNFLQFVRQIKKQVEPCYVFKGDDILLLERAVSHVKKACQVENEDLDVSIFDEENFDVDRVLNACEQLPFMAKKRLVVVKNVSKLIESQKNKLLEYCQKSNADACLVFESPKGFADFSFLKRAVSVNCEKLDNENLKMFVADQVQKSGKKISNEAANLLLMFSSNNFTKISSELQKLVSAVDDGEMINQELVQKLVGKEQEFEIFELTDQIQKKDYDKVSYIVSSMLQKKEEPTTIISLISNTFRRLFHASVSHLNDSELASQLGVKEYAITIARQKCKQFSQMQLKTICEKCLEVEYFVKSGKMPANIAIYFLIYSIFEIIK